jgi:hypothetical protein
MMKNTAGTKPIRQRPKAKVHDPPKLKIAIVGAGFSGLALANYILHHSNNNKLLADGVGDNVDVVVLESKEKPIAIIGAFRLPLSMHKVLLQLGVSIPPAPPTGGQILISRQELLALLRQKASIQYSSHVKEVREVVPTTRTEETTRTTMRKQYYISIWKENTKTSELGPFDIVVAANGLSLSEKEKWKQHCTAVIGDSRWFQHLWYDLFGLTRIQKGGAIAMTDGIELGKRLVFGRPLEHYAASWQLKRQRIKKTVVMCARLLLLLFAVFFHFYNNQNSMNTR